MRYPISKYNIVIHQHPTYHTTEIIAYSTFAGKAVYGKAICHEDDQYDEQKGIKLAVTRCAEKIALKRRSRANRMVKQAKADLIKAEQYLRDMENYAFDAALEVVETQTELKAILNKLD